MNTIVCPPVNLSLQLFRAALLSDWMPPAMDLTSHASFGRQIALLPTQAAAAYRPHDMAAMLDLLRD